MRKRIFQYFIGVATLGIILTLFLVVAICYKICKFDRLVGEVREQTLLLLMLSVVGVFLLCAIISGLLTQNLMKAIQKRKLETVEDNAKMRQEFTANVSHELKTPLTAISGYAELIANDMIAPESEIQRVAGEIHSNAKRLITLINDVIRLSELDSGAVEEMLEPVSLSSIAQTCVSMLQISAEKHHVTLRYRGEEVEILGTRQMVEEILYNLCDNAIRYNKENGSVDVVVEQKDDKAVLWVRDTGIGIPEIHQERVFERFYRVDKGRSKSTGGTGLGLAIIKHILPSLNGEIQLNSEEMQGTEIKVTFPVYVEK